MAPLSIRAARRRQGERVAVRGFIVVENGVMRLCSELLESFPPQCGGDELEVTELPPGLEAQLRAGGDVRWSDERVVISGTLDGDRLVTSL